MLWLLHVTAALAQRPDEGGLYAFDAEDQLRQLDGPAGLVRVTYSIEGPNVTDLDDDDGSGLPDFPELVAFHAEAVLEMYAELGFRAPISEEEIGEVLGGSPAFDFYLVDFGGNADGQFSTDGCDGQVCGGFMVMENDFQGYGYATDEDGIRTLTSHELFHAVQAAYRAGQESWIAEGTATWSEYQYDPGSADFFRLCDALLDDPGRSIDQPPAGPVPAFAYGTALFWQFLTERHGPAVIVALQEAEDAADGLEAVDAALASAGTGWEAEWPLFVSWNLGTGGNQGSLESYPFANRLQSVTEEQRGDALSDDNRFYPLAATYYTLDHPGGPLWFATADDPSGLQFSLFPEVDGGVAPAIRSWAPGAPGALDLGEGGEIAAGTYKLMGTYPQRADQSVKIAFCVGDEAAIAPCLPVADSGDSGDSGEGATGGGKEEPEGCGCAHPGGAAAGLIALPMLALLRRRRSVTAHGPAQ